MGNETPKRIRYISDSSPYHKNYKLKVYKKKRAHKCNLKKRTKSRNTRPNKRK